MKEYKIKTTIVLLLTILWTRNMFGSLSSQLVEEGRTWWYYYWYWDSHALDFTGTCVDFGLTLAGTEAQEDHEWQKCMVVNKIGDVMIDFPIALLRQDGDKIYILPHTLTKQEEDLMEALPDFFRYVYYRFLDISLQEEYLVYDWNMKPGDRLEYPWIYDYGDMEKVTITSCSEQGGRRTWMGTWGWDDGIFIIEGIGSVPISGMNTGSFLYPCSYREITTGLDGTPDRLYISKVTDKDGTIIYNPWTAGLDEVDTDKTSNPDIYDLHGRKVTNPVPGTIYVRDGRKFVAR